MYIDIYDQKYFEKYREMAKSEKAKRIYSTRWDLIQKYLTSGDILDYGCGPGAFNQAGPDNFKKYGYDINPACGFSLLPFKDWDAVTFWDSLEHIPDFPEVVKRLKPKYLFITCPNLEAVKCPITEWRHYRPGEHLYYFDKYSLEVILDALGYDVKESNFLEGGIRNPDNPKWILTTVAERKSDAFVDEKKAW